MKFTRDHEPREKSDQELLMPVKIENHPRYKVVNEEKVIDLFESSSEKIDIPIKQISQEDKELLGRKSGAKSKSKTSKKKLK